MDNSQIIAREAVAQGVYTPEEVEQILSAGKELPLHTLQGWNKRGCHVKKGSKGIPASLWVRRKKGISDPYEDEGQKTVFYLKKSYLFTIDQVERKEVHHEDHS